MNKKDVNEKIDYAYRALTECKIAENNKIVKTFRGQISSFGAAVEMGSLKPAILFFSDQGGSSVKRTNLMDAIHYILVQCDKEKARNSHMKCDKEKYSNVKESNSENTLYGYIKQKEEQGVPEYRLKEDVLSAAIAIKLAMNLFELTRE